MSRRSPRVPLRALIAPLALLGACADPTSVSPTDASSLKRSPAPDATGAVSTVMSGLNAPKQLAFAPNGALFVAETGTGAGSGPCIPAGDQGQLACYGTSGSITRLWKGVQERVITGLPSLGTDSGPQDLDFQGNGNLYVTIGLGADPASRAALGAAGANIGALLLVKPNGKWSVVADIAGFEGSANPDGDVIDSNPYGVLAEGGRQFVTDAGGNSLLEVGPKGVSLVATFPSFALPPGFPPSAHAVPTEVVRGPGGALYVSTLTGAPFLEGLAVIYRVGADGGRTVYRDGFTTISDFAFAPDGTLYVVQIATETGFGGGGAVIRVSPDGQTRETILGGLFFPTGIAVGPDRAVYVTNFGVVPGGGEVLRIAQ